MADYVSFRHAHEHLINGGEELVVLTIDGFSSKIESTVFRASNKTPKLLTAAKTVFRMIADHVGATYSSW